jgi:hypothetical protein
MGQNSAKVFNPPQSYGQANVSQISEVTPQGVAPANVLLPDQAGAGLGVNAPAAPVSSGKLNGRGRGKFFSDQDLDGFGGGGNPRKPIFPPPVKKPHLPPGGTLTAYKIDSGY